MKDFCKWWIKTMNTIPYRPAISDILIKASANDIFRAKLLSSPNDALTGLNLPPEDMTILAGIQAPTLKEYAHQVKTRLTAERS
jgi:hypothetical protein